MLPFIADCYFLAVMGGACGLQGALSLLAFLRRGGTLQPQANITATAAEFCQLGSADAKPVGFSHRWFPASVYSADVQESPHRQSVETSAADSVAGGHWGLLLQSAGSHRRQNESGRESRCCTGRDVGPVGERCIADAQPEWRQ